MTDANIPDIKGEADVLKVTEKFRLDLTDEEAARFFQELTNPSPNPNPNTNTNANTNPNPNPNPNSELRFFQELINDSVSALFPQMVETIHRWAQYWRA